MNDRDRPTPVPERTPASTVLIALGSNLGDSATILRHTIRRLSALAGSATDFRSSSLWNSTPVECPPGSPRFLNAAVAFVRKPDAAPTPEALLDALQALEREFGRRPKEVLNEPRPLDLDLIAFGSERRNSTRLVLPHPRAHLRRFVLQPAAEVAPSLVLPGQKRTIAELLRDLVSNELVTRLEPPPDRGLPS